VGKWTDSGKRVTNQFNQTGGGLMKSKQVLDEQWIFTNIWLYHPL
jgi:hypothetical protein